MNRNSFTAVMYQKQATKTISNKLKLLKIIFDYIIDLKSLQTIFTCRFIYAFLFIRETIKKMI